jgi:hypothetical protein
MQIVSLALVTPLPILRVDGVTRAIGDAAVMAASHRSAFAGTLPWSLELWGPSARRLGELPGLVSGRPSVLLADRLLDALRSLLLRAGSGRPRFALCTVERVEVGNTRLLLVGSCAPLMTSPTDSFPKAVQ